MTPPASSQPGALAAPPLRVAIVGPGALGESLARLLERGGALVARLGRRGLARGAAPFGGGPAEAEVVLVTVKSYDTRSALDGLERSGLVDADTCVVTLQNGLGNVEALVERFGAERAAGGATTHAARRRAGGEVEHVAAGETRVAPASENPAARVALAVLAARLSAHGLAVALAPALGPLVWEKACVSCALNPVTALLGAPNGVAATDADARAVAIAAAGEAARVAAALGVGVEGAAISPDRAAALAGERALAVARATAGNRSSMLQDLEAGRPTEVEALSLAVARLAAARGLAAPVNETLGRLVRAREALALGARGAESR